MAARLTKRQADRTLSAIKAGTIVNRFMDHIEGKCELSATQVRAGQALLNKVLPDQKAVEHQGDIDGKLEITWKS